MFQAVNDHALCEAIAAARQRIVLLSPGISKAVAAALEARLAVSSPIVTVVTDADDDVVRIGYGEASGLPMLGAIAAQGRLDLRRQPGLRLGVLVTDEQVIVWSPTPLAVEQAVDGNQPNGLVLGAAIAAAVASTVAAPGTGTPREQAAIGRDALPAEEVAGHEARLKTNPPVDVKLQQLTRVFSNKLQFVEFEARGAQMWKCEVRLDGDLFNADVQGTLRDLLHNRVRPFEVLRDERIAVPDFDVDGKPVVDATGAQRTRLTTERELGRQKDRIAQDFFYEIKGYGNLIEKECVQQFQARAKALEVQLLVFAKAMKAKRSEGIDAFVEQGADLVLQRLNAARAPSIPTRASLVNALRRAVLAKQDKAPEISIVFKDVTWQQTQDEKFRRLVDKKLPAGVKKRIGPWTESYRAAAVTDRDERLPTS